MTEKILFVDDEPNILDGIRRQLRRDFDVVTAVGPEEGLQIVDAEPLAVVVSDMKMPGMGGAEFLSHVRARQPEAVRMVLTGYSDLETTMAAVNRGNIFRFLMKPCATEGLTSALAAGLEQFRLVRSEHELLDDTLSGAVQLLTDVLEVVQPTAFSRSARVQRFVDELLEALGVPPRWELGMAGRLSMIGCLTLPEDLLWKALAGHELNQDDAALFETHPEVARQLITRIPRLDQVADIVGAQLLPRSVAPAGAHPSEWDLHALGVQVLAAATRLDRLLGAGETHGAAIARIRNRGDIHKTIVRALAAVRVSGLEAPELAVGVDGLRAGMVLRADIRTSSGALVLATGFELTDAIIMRLKNFAARGDVVEPFRVEEHRAQDGSEPLEDPIGVSGEAA